MISRYLCLSCGEVYDSPRLNITNGFDIYCPKTNCYGELVEVDELMIPTIKTLNEKGYRTVMCCSGHYTKKNPLAYIYFVEGIDIPSIPAGFKKEIRHDGCVMACTT